MRRKIIFFIYVILVLGIISFFIYNINEKSKYNFPKQGFDSITKQLDSFKLDDYNKVMIVAHPDDEMLWGGGHLIEDNYLVICVTCGTVKERVIEFDNVMKEVNSPYLMLGYPDLTNGKRDSWDEWYDMIEDDIEEILNYKEWEMVVTHNPEGEYGHQHHVMTSKIVTARVVKDLVEPDKLYFFGKYYSAKKISNYNSDWEELSEETLKKKKKIMKLYVSQKRVIDNLSHMHPYELFIKYSDWENIAN